MYKSLETRWSEHDPYRQSFQATATLNTAFDSVRKINRWTETPNVIPKRENEKNVFRWNNSLVIGNSRWRKSTRKSMAVGFLEYKCDREFIPLHLYILKNNGKQVYVYECREEEIPSW